MLCAKRIRETPCKKREHRPEAYQHAEKGTTTIRTRHLNINVQILLSRVVLGASYTVCTVDWKVNFTQSYTHIKQNILLNRFG